MYRRILLKLSGEVCADPDTRIGVHFPAVHDIATSIASLVTSVDVVIVIGGGNIIRGAHESSHLRSQATGDHMGMLGTMINALALQNAFENINTPSRVLSAFPVGNFCEPYSRTRGLDLLSQKNIVICGGGTGNPYFTTDTTAALRAAELSCDVILKGTKVDGVYDSDPQKNSSAHKYDTLTYTEALEKNLQIMDSAAFSLCRDHRIPVIVFNVFDHDALQQILSNPSLGTRITPS